MHDRFFFRSRIPTLQFKADVVWDKLDSLNGDRIVSFKCSIGAESSTIHLANNGLMNRDFGFFSYLPVLLGFPTLLFSGVRNDRRKLCVSKYDLRNTMITG